MKDKAIGTALCGSFCTLAQVFPVLEELADEGARLVPIMSEIVYRANTRFGTAQQHQDRLLGISGAESIIHTIEQAEPIGPKKLLDVLLIAPCTGNTLAKLAAGMTDTPVAMAAKAHLRNGRPLVIAIATNDGLAASAKNIGMLLNTKGVYFVPFGQDDCNGKPNSLIADFTKIPDTIRGAMAGRQIQPLLLQKALQQ